MMKNKKIDFIAVILISLGILSAAFYLFIMIFAPILLPSATVPLFGGIFFAAVAIFRFVFKNKKAVKIATDIMIVFCILLFAVIQCLIFGKVNSKPEGEFDYLMVLGCSLDGVYPSDALKMRLDTAVEYANKYPDCKIILAGGQGENEVLPESRGMLNYLTGCGIDEDRLIEENSSRNTIQNFENSKKILDKISEKPDYTVAFITGGFHIYRSELIAKNIGMNAFGISAPYPVPTALLSHIREFASIIIYALKLL